MDTPAFSLQSKHNLSQQLLRMSALWASCAPPWSGCITAELSHSCNGPGMASTQACSAYNTPSPSRLGTRGRSSTPAISSYKQMKRPSLESHTTRAYRPAPARRPSQLPTTTAGTPATQGAHTLSTLLHMLEIYIQLSTLPACLSNCVYVIND